MFDTSWALLTAAFIATSFGIAFLALAMEVHWAQVQGAIPLRGPIQILLRALGIFMLALSLGLCMASDHVSMASLVWIMLVAVGSVSTAFVLAWRPYYFRPLLIWLPGNVARHASKSE